MSKKQDIAAREVGGYALRPKSDINYAQVVGKVDKDLEKTTGMRSRKDVAETRVGEEYNTEVDAPRPKPEEVEIPSGYIEMPEDVEMLKEEKK